MAFTHDARHLVLIHNGDVLSDHQDLEEAVTAAETFVDGSETQGLPAYIVQVTRVVEIIE